MDLYKSVRQRIRGDEGVSPVIAVILMVAITVVLAATVYVWVSGFASEDTGPEQASATAKVVDLDDNGDVEWVRMTLNKGNNAPYSHDDVTISATGHDGSSITAVAKTAQACTEGTDCFGDTSSDEWDVGENLWVDCTGAGNHIISVSVRGTTILDSTIKCDE